MSNEFFKHALKNSVEIDTRPTKPAEPPAEKIYAKAVDQSSKEDKQKAHEEKLSDKAKIQSSGIAGDNLSEPLPEYIDAPCEVVYSNKNGSFLVLGRDRPGSRLSGYGGSGDTKAAAIDLVVGRVGFEAGKVNDLNEPLYVDPSFRKDSARIYISQKTDLDTNFDLADGSVGNSKTKSGIALKADGIRLIAREGIKLITRSDKFNSQGGACRSIQGVDIIAGNDDSDLQSMVKGENVAAALKRLTHHVDKLSGIVDAFLMSQFEYNAKIANHFHTSPFFGIPTLPSEVLVPAGVKCSLNQLTKVKRSLLNFKVNLANFQVTYLNVYGKNYICSRWNKVN
jgi:hypothetical protein